MYSTIVATTMTALHCYNTQTTTSTPTTTNTTKIKDEGEQNTNALNCCYMGFGKNAVVRLKISRFLEGTTVEWCQCNNTSRKLSLKSEFL